MQKHFGIGGMIAGGFDASGKYLLTVSHSGRGVYDTATWEKLIRDYEPMYPENGQVPGIGPIAGMLIPVTEMDYDTGSVVFSNADDSLRVRYSEGSMMVESFARKERCCASPLMVRLALWRISTRSAACRLLALSFALALVCPVLGMIYPIFFTGLIFVVYTFWCILAIRWVDENGKWADC